MKRITISSIVFLCVLAHILPIPNQIWQYDKAIHIATYSVLYCIFLYLANESDPLSIASQLFAFGILIEILQAFSGRNADFADIGANGVGLSIVYYSNYLINKFSYMKKIFTIIALFALSFQSFAQCEINPDSCALAVKIKSITVQKSVIVLETSEEANINYFALTDTEGSELMRITAKNTPSVYNFAVQKSGTYRIKVVNLDNSVEYTKYVTVANTAVNYIMTANAVYFDTETLFQVYDLSGRVIQVGNASQINFEQKGVFVVKTPQNLIKFVKLF